MELEESNSKETKLDRHAVPMLCRSMCREGNFGKEKISRKKLKTFFLSDDDPERLEFCTDGSALTTASPFARTERAIGAEACHTLGARKGVPNWGGILAGSANEASTGWREY